jgi:hypothetical protein
MQEGAYPHRETAGILLGMAAVLKAIYGYTTLAGSIVSTS